MPGNTPVVILLQYGYATKSGKFIKGRDFINPALKEIISKFSYNIGKELSGK
jgi:hypothetical protein